MKTTRPARIALIAALTLGITACGSDDAPDAGDETATVSTSTSDSSPSDEGSEDDSDSGTSDADDSTASNAADSDLQGVLDAIEAAEKEADGTAYEVDDQDDNGSWEIDVAQRKKSIEVEVSEDGKATIDDEDDLDGDDRDGIKAAKITVGDAIEAALEEVDGTFDDVELDEEDGSHYWEVSVDSADGDDDVEVRIDVTDGTVISVDD